LEQGWDEDPSRSGRPEPPLFCPEGAGKIVGQGSEGKSYVNQKEWASLCVATQDLKVSGSQTAVLEVTFSLTSLENTVLFFSVPSSGHICRSVMSNPH
jgi:hypothetical protein